MDDKLRKALIAAAIALALGTAFAIGRLASDDPKPVVVADATSIPDTLPNNSTTTSGVATSPSSSADSTAPGPNATVDSAGTPAGAALLPLSELPDNARLEDDSGFNGAIPLCNEQQLPQGIYGTMSASARYEIGAPGEDQTWFSEGIRVFDSEADAANTYNEAITALNACLGQTWPTSTLGTYQLQQGGSLKLGDKSATFTWLKQNSPDAHEDAIIQRGQVILVVSIAHSSYVDNKVLLMRARLKTFAPKALTKLDDTLAQ